MDFFTAGTYLKESVENKVKRTAWTSPDGVLYLFWANDTMVCHYTNADYLWTPSSEDLSAVDYETV